jgi:hypothetical protein
MAYCIGIEDGGAGCDGAARNAPARHGTEGVKASTAKPTAPTVETSSGMKASPTMETTTSAMKTASTTKPARDALG